MAVNRLEDNVSHSEQPPTLSAPEVIFDAVDPRMNEVPREERIRMYYARELAAGNMNVLTRRFISSDYESDNPDADSTVADPLNDPKVSELASVLKAAGYKPELETLD